MDAYAIAIDIDLYNGKYLTSFLESEDSYTEDLNQVLVFYDLENASLQCEGAEYVVGLKEDESGSFIGFEKIIVDANA
ncbi:hypothetical protein [Paenibacillus sp. S25]|uniref:hypothetical protein n=1 Tax=Paenibacillus sp. S25 TaxID=2823905 RepID=UPI001C653DA5|nr:hypothetical protein [Paenibacillus sp. S25]QYK62611.1 hypothetical protein KAI37_02941 [Paenibacillus sp. S25]